MAALEAPTLRQAAELPLFGGACGSARGCPLIQAGLATSEAATPMRDDMAARCRQGEAAVRPRVIRAQRAGGLPTGTDAEALTMRLVALLRGMAVLAADGADQPALEGMARLGLNSLPLGR